jgi:ABC-type oligopeptide transport system substrate-binding subunit
MLSPRRIISKMMVALALIVLLSLGFAISGCKENSNTSVNKKLITPESVDIQPVGNDTAKSPVDMKVQRGNLTGEQFQDNPPTASRPRFPTPKPTPTPALAPVQGREGGSQ